jgi:SOS-response transcriptional repressor LexA
MGENSTSERIKTLAYEHPEWIDVVRAYLSVANRVGSADVAGSWVYQELQQQRSVFLPNNLRLLVRAGILEKVGDSTRAGHRAYYRMLNIDEVRGALAEVNDPGILSRPRVSIPYFANLASCGGPNMSEAHIDHHIEVDSRLAKPGYEYFAVRADGDSMDLSGIHSGDLLLVRAQNHADIGQKVIACLDDGVTVKELQHRGDHVVLMPRSSNPANKPIVLTASPQIQGIVVSVIPGFK